MKKKGLLLLAAVCVLICACGNTNENDVDKTTAPPINAPVEEEVSDKIIYGVITSHSYTQNHSMLLCTITVPCFHDVACSRRGMAWAIDLYSPTEEHAQQYYIGASVKLTIPEQYVPEHCIEAISCIDINWIEIIEE